MLILTIEWEASLVAALHQQQLTDRIYKAVFDDNWSFQANISYGEKLANRIVVILEVDEPDSCAVRYELRKYIGTSIVIEGIQHPIRLHIGSYYSETDHEIDKLRSSYALQLAKNQGCMQLGIFDQSKADQYNRHIIIEAMLRDSIQHKHFTLAYQPIYHLKEGVLVGFEALVRWNHPELGVINPMEFIPLAEHSGIIIELGDWVINEACRQLYVLHQLSGQSKLYISINVSAIQLKYCDIVSQALKHIEQYQLQPGDIQFELTECTMELVDDNVISTVKALRQAGFNVAIDDFGTGYASLECLNNLPVDCVKLDKHFIQKLEDHHCFTIVKHTINMLSEMNIQIIAEGIETNEQYQKLLQLGCSWAQGYYMSQPISLAQIGATELHKLMVIEV